MHAVRIIKQFLGLPVYDSRLGEVRPLRYADMAVLMPAVKNSGEVFYKAFTDAGIPVYLERSEGYFDTLEIGVFLSLLRVIDNRRQDVPLLSGKHVGGGDEGRHKDKDLLHITD